MPGPGRIKAIFFDLDDTLVLTGQADVQALRRVCELAGQLLPGLDTDRLLRDWRVLFQETPWDPEGQVGALGDGSGEARQRSTPLALHCTAAPIPAAKACPAANRQRAAAPRATLPSPLPGPPLQSTRAEGPIRFCRLKPRRWRVLRAPHLITHTTLTSAASSACQQRPHAR